MITIALVDDQRVVLAGFQTLLDHSKYSLVGEALTGEAAIELTLSKKPDILILDLLLEGSISGLDVCKNLKAKRSPTKIIMVSSDKRLAKVKACIKAGAKGYVWKGGATKLKEAIDKVMNGEIYVDLDLYGAEAAPSPINELANDKLQDGISLTNKELEVICLMAEENLSASGVGKRLVIATQTVYSHLKSIYSKLDVRTKADAIRKLKGLGYL